MIYQLNVYKLTSIFSNLKIKHILLNIKQIIKNLSQKLKNIIKQKILKILLCQNLNTCLKIAFKK